MNDIANNWQLFHQLLQGTINSNERYRLQLLLDNIALLECYLDTITPLTDTAVTASLDHPMLRIQNQVEQLTH